MPRILLVDDEKIYSRMYVDSLRSKGLHVSYSTGPLSARRAIQTEPPFDIFVLDLMLPSQGCYPIEATDGDLFTGACLAKEIHELVPNAPIIIFTMAHSKFMISNLRKMLSHIPNVTVLKKSDLDPQAFSEAVVAMLQGASETSKVIDGLRDSVILQPKMFGVGIDLMKLRRIFTRK